MYSICSITLAGKLTSKSHHRNDCNNPSEKLVPMRVMAILVMFPCTYAARMPPKHLRPRAEPARSPLASHLSPRPLHLLGKQGNKAEDFPELTELEPQYPRTTNDDKPSKSSLAYPKPRSFSSRGPQKGFQKENLREPNFRSLSFMGYIPSTPIPIS